MKIQIKSIYNEVIFEYEKENNTIKDTVEEAVKQKVNFYCANLKGIDLSYADLHLADFRFAYLRGTNLNGANLSCANLYGSNLQGAYLREADLSYAYLNSAYLREANFHYANLYGATLYKAKNIPQIPLNCPSEGAFIAWKKVEGKLVKLEISEDAKRSSATTNKCRCDKAKVLSITDLDGSNPIGEILNTSRGHELLYKVGEMVYPDSFDEDRWNECSHGIHFFVNKLDAINYFL